jgi:hypothetical protein
MSLDRHLPSPPLRRRIEEALQASPAGITTATLRQSLAQRARTLGEVPVGSEQLLCQLGRLLVEGQIDESDGVWMLTDARWLAVGRHTYHWAA